VQGADGTLGPNGAQPAPNPFGGGFFMIMLLFLVVMLVLPAMAGRKQKKQRAEMLSSIARHDRVQTVGGMIGTVAEIRDDEVVLKVDESTNTKIRFARSSIQQVLKKAGEKTDAAPAETPEMANV
jgi:preprotein translocase subunit YajC